MPGQGQAPAAMLGRRRRGSMVGRTTTNALDELQPDCCSVSTDADLHQAKIGIVTVSDRASSGEYEDRSGPAIQSYFAGVLSSSWKPVSRLVPDDRERIEAVLRELSELGCALIVTTGGTGPAPRDVTPEATAAVCQKMLPGFGELMRQVSLKKVATAILSRQTAGILGSSLIVNLPGQPKAIAECLDAVMPAIPYCIDLLGGPALQTNPNRVVAFRPPR